MSVKKFFKKRTHKKVRSYLYFIQSIYGGNIKIGIADDPQRRLRQLNTGSDEELEIRGLFHFYDRQSTFDKETELHHKFHYLNIHLEWFKPGPALLIYMLTHGIMPNITVRTFLYCLKAML